MFHVHNDCVRQQVQDFTARSRVTEQQLSGTIPKRLERLFLQLFIPALAKGYEIREHRTVKSQADHFDWTFK